jgi:hypothetical protein
LQPKPPIFEEIDIFEAREIRNKEVEESNDIIFKLKAKLTKYLLILNSICFILLYLSCFVEPVAENDPDNKNLFNFAKFFMIYTGIYYSEKSQIHSFMYQSLGYIMLIGLCIIERTGEVWIKTKFGCKDELFNYFKTVDENKKYQTEKAKIWLRDHFDDDIKLMERIEESKSDKENMSSKSERLDDDFDKKVSQTPRDKIISQIEK